MNGLAGSGREGGVAMVAIAKGTEGDWVRAPAAAKPRERGLVMEEVRADQLRVDVGRRAAADPSGPSGFATTSWRGLSRSLRSVPSERSAGSLASAAGAPVGGIEKSGRPAGGCGDEVLDGRPGIRVSQPGFTMGAGRC